MLQYSRKYTRIHIKIIRSLCINLIKKLMFADADYIPFTVVDKKHCFIMGLNRRTKFFSGTVALRSSVHDDIAQNLIGVLELTSPYHPIL